VAILAAAVAGLVACIGTTSPDGTPLADLTVLAAASLREPLAAIEPAFRTGTSIALTVSTDSSTALRVQIEEGARADVFLAADLVNPEALVAAALTSGVPTVFARNRLAIVVPKGNPAGLETPWDIGRPGLRVVAAGESVPISQYAMLLVENLAGLHGGGSALADAYAANVVSREDNVAAVLTKVELGEADAAIVYATDAAGSELVESMPIPDEAQVDVAYGGVILATSVLQPHAHAFLEWLGGADGQAMLEDFGFRPVR
jgi:molybdate transport system substrate-binding protein